MCVCVGEHLTLSPSMGNMLRIRHVNAQQIESKLLCQTSAKAFGFANAAGLSNVSGNGNVESDLELPLICYFQYNWTACKF